MMAGVARIVEVSFIAPKYTPITDSGATDDNHSEHTLADVSTSSSLWQSVKAFRHLPPFVSVFLCSHEDLRLSTLYSCSLPLGMYTQL